MELQGLIDGFERARVRYQGARVAVVGRPNVGKSSLLNAIAGRERALVTPIAGTTRDVVEAVVAVDGAPVVLMDTAGIRETPELIEGMGIARSRAAIEDAACVVAVFDRSTILGADDQLVATLVRGRETVAVLNKSDLAAAITVADVQALLGDVPVVEASALEERGIERILSLLAVPLFQRSSHHDAGEVSIYRTRHRDAARRAVAELTRAADGLMTGSPLELVASDLASAAAALGDITGEITSEDVLDRVFAEFCIGK